MKNGASLDCELSWGITTKSDDYMQSHVKHAQVSLEKIIASWTSQNCDLFLAFVVRTIPYFESDPSRLLNRLHTYTEVVFSANQSNIFYGLHSYEHNQYNEMTLKEYNLELERLKKVLDNDKRFEDFFVYPKNQSFQSGQCRIPEMFKEVRVNSRSWLYRSSKEGVTPLKRILRYLDSFIPIYELFCDKSPELDTKNSVVGTHFYRANLRGVSLVLHVLRLKIGFKFMNMIGQPVHLWTHPHNFGGNEEAISKFIKLGELLSE